MGTPCGVHFEIVPFAEHVHSQTSTLEERENHTKVNRAPSLLLLYIRFLKVVHF